MCRSRTLTGVTSYLVVGGGIIGTAVAARLQVVDPHAEVTLWEKEPSLAAHQTGRNSGVVHAGLYYEPGSLKAQLCRRGVGLLKTFCEEEQIAYDECGKLLVALDAAEASRLGAIEERARANGVPGVRRLDAAAMQELEPTRARGGRAALPDHRDRGLRCGHPGPRRSGRGPRRDGAARHSSAPRCARNGTASWSTTPTGSTASSSAAGSRATGWRCWRGATATRGSCRSAATTTWCDRSDARWSTA